MTIFTFMALMLVGVIAANVIEEFFPKISETYILIAVGILLAFLPNFQHFELEPEFFMMFIIAPLMFYDGTKNSLRSVRRNFRGIFILSVLLALVTILAIAALTHFIIPGFAFPLAIAFGAIVTPTDAIAVKSITAGRIVPKGVNEAVEYESLFNDATGLVLLGLGLSVLESGHFSILNGLGNFAYVAIGGILIGLLAGAILVWTRTAINLRSSQPEAIIIPISLLTPFIVFILAEHFGTSGILAVVATGLVHNFEGDSLKLTSTKVQILNNSLWNVFTELLNDFVFMLLGISLVSVAKIFWKMGIHESLFLIFVSILIYFIMLLIRFLWGIREENRSIRLFLGTEITERTKNSWIFSLSGAHGTMTLAMALSLPIGSTFLSNDLRELIIALATLVIIWSLVFPSVILPKMLPAVERKIDENIDAVRSDMIDQALVNIAPNIADDAVRNSFTMQLQSQKGLKWADRNQSIKLMNEMNDFQLELLHSDQTKAQFSDEIIAFYDQQLRADIEKAGFIGKFRLMFSSRHRLQGRTKMSGDEIRAEFLKLEAFIFDKTIEKLVEIEQNRWENHQLEFDDIDEIKRIFVHKHRQAETENNVPEHYFIEAFQMEYQYIQDLAKSDKITRETLKILSEEINNSQTLIAQRENLD